jgi:hypothetical protein
MTDNALDPLPRRRSGRVPYPRIAAIVVGVVIAVGLVFVIGHIVFNHPAAEQAPMNAGFGRGGASAPTPPAVAPAQAAQANANLRALQKAAESPALMARSSQVATVSPPAGPPPGGVGVVPSRSTVGPGAG